MATAREAILHHDNPDRSRLVWESSSGPVLVEDMDKLWLEKAIAFADRTGFESDALPAMRERLSRLT